MRLKIEEREKKMDQRQAKLRRDMLKNKTFLLTLYKENRQKSKSQLNIAREFQLNLVLRILHFIANGDIDIRRVHYQRLKQARRFGGI